jgi:hypothetical protein
MTLGPGVIKRVRRPKIDPNHQETFNFRIFLLQSASQLFHVPEVLHLVDARRAIFITPHFLFDALLLTREIPRGR